MRRLFCVFFLLLLFVFARPQNVPVKSAKYPSLLWEISGNGLIKPSYLFGTMHVSSKMVFNLSDSFYTAIRNADVVALETNPASWQEDMFLFNHENEFVNASPAFQGGYRNAPDDYLTIKTLQFPRYEKQMEAALASNPSAINNLLYRAYSEKQNDFEEDTYLDLYIYQVGKKWGKRVFGVERYEESMKLAMEAYVDGMKDKNRRDRNFDLDDDFSYSKLQDAYRTGNLDLLDTINRVNSFSDAFDEKFLYRRNDIQAASIDSILKSGSALFVGVGAAHLPGERGVIEYLRKQGYKLRPVKMGQRSSHQKEALEKVKVPVAFQTQTAEDGLYKVDVPGKLYRHTNPYNGFDQAQYADMANGSYYMVTRVQTNAFLWGHTSDDVLKKLDSLLYENVPGKILSKQAFEKNGCKGLALLNQTRRGDQQRYQIYITPFEVLFFKVSGSGDYIKNNPAVDRFFNSISLKETATQWQAFRPPFGGFEIEMPHSPYHIHGKNGQFLSIDKEVDVHYLVLRTDVHNFNFVEEDSFDLDLMEESFTSSSFFDRLLERKQTNHKGYPALDATYKLKDGSVALVRYIIRGPHYYTLVAQGKEQHPQMKKFLESFTIVPFAYGEKRHYTDSVFNFSVKTPYYPQIKNRIEVAGRIENIYLGNMSDDDEPEMERTIFRDKTISNDTTGEKIYVSFYKAPRYQYIKDSLDLQKQDRFLNKETEWAVITKEKKELADGTVSWEYMLSDANSSRSVWTKTLYRNGIKLTIRTQADTLSAPSSFLKDFFETLAFSGKLESNNPYIKKTNTFFNDFFSPDTSLRKRAAKSVVMVGFDETDIPQLKTAIKSLSWKDKNYLTVKKDFITRLGKIQSEAATSFLKDIYYASGDTIELQYAAAKALIAQKTKFAYETFKDILLNEPPVLDIADDYDRGRDAEPSFIEGLYDSLKLTASIFKDIMPLINIDDYKYPILELLGTLVDSNLIAKKVYEKYFADFLIETKQALKKQMIVEKRSSIRQAMQEHQEEVYRERQAAYGNRTLNLYATLLMPFWNKRTAVQQLLNQVLASSDKELKYATALLFVRNGKPLPDSVLNYFASDHKYRYLLFRDLKDLDKENLFPSNYNNHIDLSTSKLLNNFDYNAPDTAVFLQKLPVQWKERNGYIYFFKYKRKKEDSQWKIASVGLLPEDVKKFDFGDNDVLYDYDFTALSEVRFRDDESLNEQLEKRKKQLLYSKRASAKEFYSNGGDVDISVIRSIER